MIQLTMQEQKEALTLARKWIKHRKGLAQAIQFGEFLLERGEGLSRYGLTVNEKEKWEYALNYLKEESRSGTNN